MSDYKSTITNSINTIKAYIKNIEAIKESFKAKFNIGNDVPFESYAEKISPIPESQTVFYKSNSYHYEPEIPEYTNIIISGISNPADANGTYVNIRPDYLRNNKKMAK